MKIVIPKLSTSNALSFCDELPSYGESDTYYFDVSKINNYEPLPMLLTSAAIRQFCYERKLAPWDIQLIFEDNRDYQYACHMGYFQAAGFTQGKAPGEAYGSSTYIPLTKLNIREMYKEAALRGEYLEQGDLIELKSKELAQILAQQNEELKNLFQFLLREAIRNVPEHAGTNDVWICGQYWHNRNKAEIAILDEGMGVFNSLVRNKVHRDYITNNVEALQWAIKPGVSRAFDPAKGQKSSDDWANSGYGLHMISEICRISGGWLTFVSNNNCLRIYSNNTQIINTSFQGTALGIRVNTNNIESFENIIDEARKNGEETAKSIKNSFKKASVPSRGLMRK